MTDSSDHDDHRSQVMNLVHQCLKSVMENAYKELSSVDALANQWVYFSADFHNRNRQKLDELIESRLIYEHHSNLRPGILTELRELLAADRQYRALTKPLRQIEKFKARSARLEEELRFLSAQKLMLSLRLLRIDVMEGRLPTEKNRKEIERKREMAPTNTKAIEHWRGADVFLIEKLDRSYAFRSSGTVVITRHAGALGSLFHQLTIESTGIMGYLNKYEFYGGAATAVNRLLRSKADVEEGDTLLAALDGAQDALKHYDNKGVFRYGPDLPGRTQVYLG